MLKKLKYLMNGYNREIDKINMQMKNDVRHKNNQTKIEKYLENINKICDTNPIFY